MKVCIIEYNAGNTASVANALTRLGCEFCISGKPEEIAKADAVIFPGVGEAASALRSLKARNLDLLVAGLKQPVLGICLGLQLLCSHTEEGDTQGLGIFRERVMRFRNAPKVPHMGWNTLSHIEERGGSSVKFMRPGYYYFVHSYYAEIGENTCARTEYGETFSAALSKDNFLGVQFHPEKSGVLGQHFLENFLCR